MSEFKIQSTFPEIPVSEFEIQSNFNFSHNNTMYKPAEYSIDGHDFSYPFLKWVPFDRFTDIKEVGEGGFAKVYSATWIDGRTCYEKQDDGSWKKQEPEPKKVALKRLNGSQNMPDKYLNEVRFYTILLQYIIS